MNVDKIHLRHVMLYEFHKGISVGIAYKNIHGVYLDGAPSVRTIKKWFRRFRDGDFNLEDQSRSGRPSEIKDDMIDTMLEKNSRLSTQEIATSLGVNISTAFRHLKSQNYISKLDSWVPHTLTERNKLQRMDVAMSLLARYKNEPFLDRLVTGDEKWILYNNVQRKRTWKKSNESPEQVSKADQHQMKVMLCIWWDCRGIIYYELLQRGETITADKYCDQLSRVDAAIRQNRPALINRKGIIFHHDNARPHIAYKTLSKLRELEYEILQHPPYSPDMAPTDFYLFQSLSNSLSGKKFCSEEAVKNHLSDFIQGKPSEFFKSGIEKLVDRWKMIVDRNGDYCS